MLPFFCRECLTWHRCGGFCVAFDFFYVDGKIEVWLAPIQNISSKTKRTAQSWLNRMLVEHPDFQCRQREDLDQAHSDALRRRRPEWWVSPALERTYIKKKQYSRWLEWRDKYKKEDE